MGLANSNGIPGGIFLTPGFKLTFQRHPAFSLKSVCVGGGVGGGYGSDTYLTDYIYSYSGHTYNYIRVPGPSFYNSTLWAKHTMYTERIYPASFKGYLIKHGSLYFYLTMYMEL